MPRVKQIAYDNIPFVKILKIQALPFMLFIALMALPPQSLAQETQPGDACAAGENGFTRLSSMFPATDGANMMFCDGANWQSVISFLSNGGVGIGSAAPGAALDIMGTIILADGGEACAGTIAGAMRYNTGTIDYCNGTTWLSFATSAGSAIFELSSGVVRNTGDDATEDFVFGSPQLADDADATHDARMFFDKSKAAFRAGSVTGTQWDDSSVGLYSTALGSGNIATGDYSLVAGRDNTITDGAGIGGDIALGSSNTVTGAGAAGAIAMGRLNSALGDGSLSLGYDNTVTGHRGVAIGTGNNADGENMALGFYVDVTGAGSLAIGASNTNPATDPIVSGVNSIGIFMGDQDGIDVVDANTLSVMGASGGIGIGTVAPENPLHVYDGTGTYQMRLGYDATEYTQLGTNSSGTFYVNSPSGGIYLSASGGDINMVPAYNGDINVVPTAGSWQPGGAGEKNFFNIGIGSGPLPAATDAKILNTYGTFTRDAAATTTGAWTMLELGTGLGLGTDDTYNGNAPMVGLKITPVVNVNTASSTGYSAIFTDITETSVSVSGNNRLLDLRVGGSELFVVDSTGSLGIGQAPDAGVELDILGDIEYTGTITDMSDRRLKDDIIALPAEHLKKITALQGVSFKMKDDTEGKIELGFIAQEVQKIYPSLIFERMDGMLSMNYTGLIAPMVEAIKTQQDIIGTQQLQIDNLLIRIKALENQ